MKDLQTVDDIPIKHGASHIKPKPKYLRGLKDISRVVSKGEAFGYKVVVNDAVQVVVEVLVFVGSLSGNRSHPGVYCGFKIKYEKSGDDLILNAALCFCYDDGLDETPIIKNLAQAKAYMESNFPTEYTIIT